MSHKEDNYLLYRVLAICVQRNIHNAVFSKESFGNNIDRFRHGQLTSYIAGKPAR